MAQSPITPWREKLWKQIRDIKPEEVCLKAGAGYINGYYSIVFMNDEYHVHPVSGKITSSHNGVLTSYPEFELLLGSYLLNAGNIPRHGKWISEKEIPGGSTFFKGPHRLPDSELKTLFGKDKKNFLETGKKFEGKSLEYGDASFEFQLLPRVPLACILWTEDDEFPARINYLFDPSISQMLPLDVILALVNCFVKKFVSSR